MEFDLYAYSMQEHQSDIYAKIFLIHREFHAEALYIITMIARDEHTMAVSYLYKMFHSSLLLEQYINTLQINYEKNKSIHFFNYIEYKSKYEDDLYYFTSIVFSEASTKDVKDFLYKNSYEIEDILKNTIAKYNFDGVVFVNEHSVSLLLKEKKNSYGMDIMEFINNYIYKKISSFASKYAIKIKIIGVKIDDIYSISSSVVPVLHLLKIHKQEEDIGLLKSSDIYTIYSKVIEIDKIKAKINRAFEENLFEIFFQPILKSSAKSKDIFVEALIRMPYNNQYLEGENFIKLIEDQNRMCELDLYVLKNLHKHIKKLSLSVKMVAINIYPTSFECEEIVTGITKLSKAFTKVGIDLIVEITEQMILTSKSNILKLAKEHGINFAIDDFGSGYSSFMQLIELVEMGVVKIIKIDGTIVKGSEINPTKYNILKSLVNMTVSLNVQPIIFEFVENEALYNKLKNLKGDILYQGYYFDRAMPIDELIAKYTE